MEKNHTNPLTFLSFEKPKFHSTVNEETNLLCPHCSAKLIEKEEICYFTNSPHKIYNCSSCHKRITPVQAQRYNNDFLPLDELIRTNPFNKVPIKKLKEFLQIKGSSKTKIELWIEARKLLGLSKTDFDDEELKKSSRKKFINEKTTKYSIEFNKTFVVPPASLRKRVCDKYKYMSFDLFDKEKSQLNEMMIKKLKNVESDFAVGLAGACKSSNLVFYSPKLKQVLTYFTDLHASKDFDEPLTTYSNTSDDKIWIKIQALKGKIAILEKEAVNIDEAYDSDPYDPFDFFREKVEKKQWGFIVDSSVYVSAWEAFIEFQRNGCPGLEKVEKLNEEFNVKVDVNNIKKMKVNEMRKACLERGLLKTYEKKVLKKELKERLMRIL